jgi:hypothetical protein
MEWNEHPLEPYHLEVPSGASKIISEPMVRLAQTMHLSCTDTNIVSKQTETRFDMAYVTKEFHQVRPKWFLSLWCVRRKPCTYLASRLALSPNRLNRASTWASLPRSTIRCGQNDFWDYGTLWRKPCSYLAPTLKLSPNQNEIPHGPRHQGVAPGASNTISKPMVRSAQTGHLSCIKISTISKRTEPSFHLSLVT